MKYRAYRREKELVKKKRLEKIADFSGYPSPALKIKVLPGGKRTCLFEGEYDFVKRLYRGKRSSYSLNLRSFGQPPVSSRYCYRLTL